MDWADMATGAGVTGAIGTVGVAVVRAWAKLRGADGDRSERREERLVARVERLEADRDAERDRCEEYTRQRVAESEERCAADAAAREAAYRRDLAAVARQTMRSLPPEDTGRFELEEVASRTPTPPRPFPPLRDSELPPAAVRARETLRGVMPWEAGPTVAHDEEE